MKMDNFTLLPFGESAGKPGIILRYDEFAVLASGESDFNNIYTYIVLIDYSNDKIRELAQNFNHIPQNLIFLLNSRKARNFDEVKFGIIPELVGSGLTSNKRLDSYLVCKLTPKSNYMSFKADSETPIIFYINENTTSFELTWLVDWLSDYRYERREKYILISANTFNEYNFSNYSLTEGVLIHYIHPGTNLAKLFEEM